MVAQKICQGILHLFGWKWEATAPDIKKCVLCVAPHTSNWDFVIGRLGYTALGRNADFVIKKEWMKGPAGCILRKMGGIGVDRSKAHRFTDHMAELYQKRDILNLAVTPEGTRKATPKWKKGFYHIALKANVPIIMVKIDYKTKTISLFDTFYPTGDETNDIWNIQQLFKDVTPRNPKNFILPEKPASK